MSQYPIHAEYRELWFYECCMNSAMNYFVLVKLLIYIRDKKRKPFKCEYMHWLLAGKWIIHIQIIGVSTRSSQNINELTRTLKNTINMGTDELSRIYYTQGVDSVHPSRGLTLSTGVRRDDWFVKMILRFEDIKWLIRNTRFQKEESYICPVGDSLW